MLLKAKRWIRRWNYLWSDCRHEEFLDCTRIIHEHTGLERVYISNQLASLANEYAYHHSDLAHDVIESMAVWGHDFDTAVDHMRLQLQAAEYVGEL
jgi:hypothetical protein